LLTAILTKECNKREITLPICFFNKEANLLITKIDRGGSQSTDDQDMISVISYLTRYSILARTIFGKLASNYAAQEEYSNKNIITAKFTGFILDKYIAKEAGVVDLLDDGEFFENEETLGVSIDFNALKSVEEQRVGKPFPRMQR
jgi:hypothetical protein